jgi:sulfide dehydrogenase cytochrome subunit
MKYRLKYVLLLAGGLVLSSSSCWAAELTRGAMLGNTCAGCHGTNGVSQGTAIPNLAGKSVDTIKESMQAYKKGDRTSTIMGRLAKGYSDEEIVAMAEFFAQQPYVPAKQEFDAAKAKAGAKLHEKHCEKCHEEGGKIDEDGTGILAGQWTPYLQYQLADFQAGERDMPKKMKAQMKKVLAQDADKKLDELLNFYASQQSGFDTLPKHDKKGKGKDDDDDDDKGDK